MTETVINRSQSEREQDIAALREKIGELRRSEAVKREHAEAFVQECKGAGLNPALGLGDQDKEAFKRIQKAYLEADTIAHDATTLENNLRVLVVANGHEADGKARGDIEHPAMKSALNMAEAFMASEGYKQLKASGALTEMAMAPVKTPAVTVATRERLMSVLFPSYTAALNVDALVPDDQRLFPPVPFPVRALKVRDLVTVGTTDTDMVEYVEETTRTDAAAETSYGVDAPESTYEYTRREASVKRIPHFVKATKGNLADAGQLRTLLDNRLVYGVGKRLDTQAISGSGAGDDLRGILNTSNLQEVQAPGGAQIPDAFHRGLTAVRLSLEDEPDAFLVHPSTYQAFVTAKGTDGHYLNLQGPQTNTPPNIWGKPAVLSTVISSQSALVGNWKMGATLWLRSGISVAATDSDSTDFRKGIITILAEMRAAFAVTQVKAFAEITGFGLT